jgi:5-methylcytosine-specific restriction endonuclease McrA
MGRNRNTKTDGQPFENETIQKVWEKGELISGEDKDKIRKDLCGKKIERLKHGKTASGGWEIDHKKPVAKEGRDDLSNLQPLFWETNRDKSDTYPWICP